MKKHFLKSFALLAMLFSALTMSAKHYCQEPLTLSGGATIQLSCELVSAGNYRITIEGENLKGLGGSFYNPGAVELRTVVTTNTPTKIVCDIAAASAPTLYTPLYVLCPLEQNISWPNDIDWTDTCGEGGEEPDPTPDPEPEPEIPSVEYCDFPTGHNGEANFGDVNGRILVSVVKKSETAVRLVVKSADAATKNLDLLYVEAAGANPNATTVGSDVAESDLREMSVDITYPTAPAKYTFMIQWSHPDWAGRWQTNLNDITVEQLCTEGGGEGGDEPEPTPEPELEPSTYCQTPLTVSGKTIYMTTEKVSDGNYRMTVEGENLMGFGGSFFHPLDGQVISNFITSSTPTKIVCDIAAPSAPIFYTPLYVNMPGEVVFSELNGKNIVWGKCDVSDLAYSDLAIVSPSTLSHSLAIGETFTIGLSTSSTGAITYTSSNTDVAEVSASGIITAKAIGTTTITVSQAEDANYQSGEKSFTLDVIASAIPSNKGFGTYQGRVDLYDWNGDYAGSNACGQVDLYVVTWGNDMLYKAKVVDNKFEDGTDWKCQLRTRNADLSDGIRESWGKAIADDGATRYSEYGNTYNNHSGLVGYGETFKMWSYMVIAGCGARTMKTLTYTRDYINNPISDNAAPTLPGAANVTSTAENVTIALPAVTSEEVFYMIKDEAHNKQYISLTPAFVLPQDGSGITYTYSCYAVDFNGNMSTPLTAEVSMAFNATSNLALNKPCQAGNEEGTNVASNANDGKNNTLWASGVIDVTNIWWYVDLGESYNLSTIEISWEGACANDYVIKASDEYIDPANASAWESATTLVHQTEAPTTGENTQIIHNVTSNHARYLRLQANSLSHNGAYGGKMYEFRVFGTGVYDPNAAADTEKPVITSATPKTPIAHNEVQITMEASDNVGVVAYEVSGSGVSATCVPVDNVITVSNLQEQTTYNLSIVAVDAVGNKSDAYAMAAFTTGVNPYIPHASAPIPTRDAEDVVSFYSDAYTPAINLWGKNQWTGVNFSENNIAGNKYLHYAGNITNLGWEYNVNAGYTDGEHTGVNCSEMEYLHIDIWGYVAGTIRVIPIYGGTGLQHNEGYHTDVEILAGQWNSVDIALADFEGNAHDFSSIYQFKFTNCNNTIAIDNVYFWKSAGTAPVESITLDKTTATIEVEESLQLTATILPVEAANKNVIWTSSNTSVATISAEGLVTGLTPGTTTITAASEENGEIKATCEITVEPITAKTWWGEPTTIKIEGVDVAILYSYTRNENKTITYSVIFDNPASAKRADINVNVADVYNLMQDDGTGNNTAFWTSATTHSKGEKITGFWYLAGNHINFDYIVGSSNERPNVSVASVVLDQASCSLLVGETVQLTATINPGTAANKTITWSSNNESIATVNNGLVTAKSAGTAIITVTTQDGNKTATCTVNVVAALTDVTYHANAFFIENGRFVGFNYSITRTAERKLHYEATVNGNVVGLVVEINDGNWHGMVYDADSKSYSYTTDNTYADGITTINHFFYVKFAGGAQEVDADYTVGSTNSPVRTKVAFNDTQDPQTLLQEYMGQAVDVIVNRSLVSGMYNTICLPFSLPSLLGTDLAGATLVRFLNAEVVGEGSNRELTLYFTPAQSIEAGVPYLIIPATDIAGPMMFNSVTIACTEATTSGSGDVIYQGILAPTELTANDYNSLFLISNNQLAWPEETGSMNGMRGYFKVSPSTASLLRSVNARARIQLHENQTTSLPSIEEDSDMVKFIRDGQLYIQRGEQLYNAQGQLVE